MSSISQSSDGDTSDNLPSVPSQSPHSLPASASGESELSARVDETQALFDRAVKFYLLGQARLFPVKIKGTPAQESLLEQLLWVGQQPMYYWPTLLRVVAREYGLQEPAGIEN